MDSAPPPPDAPDASQDASAPRFLDRVVGALRRFARRRAARMAGIAVAMLLGTLLVSALGFHAACKGPGERDAPYDRPEVAAFAEEIPDYKRPEESTYLTLMEWYQVFSYQEYAAHLQTERPSAFPYFAAIGQSWTMYCRGYGLTSETYPFNFGNHLMLFVIGTSFSAEYALKGVYENIFGRLTELVSWTTEEDRYAASVHDEFGQFIPWDPWYVYPYGKRAVGIWTEPDLFGWELPRKIERKVFFSLEHFGKAGYAGVIRVATGAIYGAPPATDYLWVANFSETLFEVEGVRKVREMGAGEYVIALPHYQGFTDAVPMLARGGARFVDIAGNDEIVLTALAPRDWEYTLQEGEELFCLDVLINRDLKRVVVRAPVPDLHAVITGLEAEGAEIEHLFDY